MKTPYAVFSLVIATTFFGTVPMELASTCFAQSPWTQKADMHNIRQGHSSGVLDSIIYVVGGVQYNTASTHFNAIKSMEFYDPDQDAWTTKAEMDTGRIQFPTCVFEGKIYAIGGGQSVYWDPLKSIEVYDPGTNNWTPITNMPIARMGHTASMVNGKIYIIGGADSNDWNLAALVPKVDVYDPLTNTWDSTKADLPTPRMNLQSVVLNEKIYAIGGHRGLENGELGLQTVEEYDPATDTWTTISDMIWPRKYFTACAFNDKIYVFGGAYGYCKDWSSSVEVYDPETDTWTDGTPLPEYWGMAAAAPYNDMVYVSGGTFVACPPDVQGILRTYTPYYDLWPLIEKTEVDKSYAKPGVDSVCIITKTRDSSGLKLYAKIEAGDGTQIDSIQLLDDGNHNDENAGDGIYANYWPVGPSEGPLYYVDLQVTSIDKDTVINQFNDMARITTVGPVTSANYSFVSTEDTVFNPGDILNIKLTLKNNGSTVTALNITAELASLDPAVVYVSSNASTFSDIAAGDSSVSSSFYQVKIMNDCPVNAQIPVLVEIMSDDYMYWTDTFNIHVQDPTNLENIRKPVTGIYPNPANNFVVVETIQSDQKWIEITSLNGNLIFSAEMEGTTHQLDLSTFQKGVYFITIRSKDFVTTRKIIKL